MKKWILAILALFNVAAQAQSNLRLGAHFDPIVSWFSPKSSSIEKDGARPGYSGGLSAEYYFRPNYAFAGGLSLTSLGGNLLYRDETAITRGSGDDVVLEAGTTVAYTLSYLTIPATLKMKTNQIGFLTYFAQLGFYPQINIGSRAKSTDHQLQKDNVSAEINAVTLSYGFGGGIEYNIGGQTAIELGLFFNNGFADVLSKEKHRASLNFLTLRVGIMF